MGTFDIPHVGHAAFLKKCEEFGHVTVGLNSDAWVLNYKGHLPLYSYLERLKLLSNLGYDIIPNNGPGASTILSFRPDILVIGSDWLEKDYLSQIKMSKRDLEVANISLIFVPYTPNISTSDIRARIERGD